MSGSDLAFPLVRPITPYGRPARGPQGRRGPTGARWSAQAGPLPAGLVPLLDDREGPGRSGATRRPAVRGDDFPAVDIE